MNERKFGYYVFAGLLVGALFGFLSSAHGNPMLEIGIGALVGTAIGQFAAAAALERKEKER